MCISGSVGRNGGNAASDVKTVQLLLNLDAATFAAELSLAVDGVMGDETASAIESFQANAMGLPTPDGQVEPGSPTLEALAAQMPPGLSADKVQGIMINAGGLRVTTFAGPLITKMAARAIDSPPREAHFLAQIGHESGELRYTQEIASGAAYQGRRDLGNTEPGDGRRFKGRGLIQLTGRANYRAYGNAIGIDLLSGDSCRLLDTDPNLAVDVAGWFWQSHGLNALADQDDIEGITRRINGGLNGLENRKRLLGRAKFFLAV